MPGIIILRVRFVYIIVMGIWSHIIYYIGGDISDPDIYVVVRPRRDNRGKV